MAVEAGSPGTSGTVEAHRVVVGEDVRAAAAEVAQLHGAVYRRYHVSRRALPGSDVTPRMLGALQHLAVAGPLTIGEAAAHLDLSKAAATELVDRLTAKGLVTRMRDDRDHRRVFVWLTEAGRAQAAAHPRVLEGDVLARAMEHMRPDDRAHLIEGLRALVEVGKELDR